MSALLDTAWFAGFVDGEASFYIQGPGGKRGNGHMPGLAICLRADDLAILQEIKNAIGGNLNLRDSVAVRGGRNPQVRWSVHAKAALGLLVEYFDRCPLRAKKARDYIVWREAVMLYISHGRNHPDLPLLKQLLEGGRVYRESAEVVHLRAAGGGDVL